jgi:hypothetical protein
VPTLAYKLDIYETVYLLQGNSISICLGLLKLKGPYYLPSPNYLIYFLLLLFGGFRLLYRSNLLSSTNKITSSARIALKKLYRFNLTYRDLRVENLL